MSELADDPSLVVALRYDEVNVARELATWCGGDVKAFDGPDMPPIIWVPTDKGPRPATLGDWIVRRMAGGYYPCSPEDFAARHSPTD